MNMDDLSLLEGRLRHCVRYRKGKKGKTVCASYSAGPGGPRGRRKASITRKFRETSTTKKRAHRVCRKRVLNRKTGKRVCRAWRYISATALRRRHRKGKKTGCLRWGKSKVGKKVCRKWSPSIIRKRAKAKKRTYGTKGLSRRKAAARKRMARTQEAAYQAMQQTGTDGLGRISRRRKARKTSRVSRRRGRR